MSEGRPAGTATERASLRALVSGIISAAADNDPTTVATLAVAGATVVYKLNWLILLIVPMLGVVQVIGTQVAAVSREGMQSAIRRRFGTMVATFSLFSLLAVNVVTLAADLDAGAAAIGLLTKTSYIWWTVPIAVLMSLALTFGTFAKLQKVLLVFPLAFLTYIAAAFVVHPNWHAVALGFIPHIETSKDFIASVLALLGTTLTAYAYFWQTVEVAEDPPPRRTLPFVQLSALPGTLITGAVLFFILTATAATLGVHHQQVNTAEDAARALQPIAGRWASIIFSIGLLGSALLALPVIAAGSAIATSSTFRLGGSLDKKPHEARRFYAVLFGGIAAATLVTLFRVEPIHLLFVASIAGGVATPVTLGLLLLLGRDRRTMQDDPVHPVLATAGWAIVAITVAGSIALLRWH